MKVVGVAVWLLLGRGGVTVGEEVGRRVEEAVIRFEGEAEAAWARLLGQQEREATTTTSLVAGQEREDLEEETLWYSEKKKEEFVEKFVTRRLLEETAAVLKQKGIEMPKSDATKMMEARIETCAAAEDDDLARRRKKKPPRLAPKDDAWFETVECLDMPSYGRVENCTPTECGRGATKLASELEASRLRNAVDKAMDGLFSQGGQTSLSIDSSARGRLGEDVWPLVLDLRARVKRETEAMFKLAPRTLHDAGGLFNRLDAEPRRGEFQLNESHVYWNAHVDKANIYSYDYSALLYLSTEGVHFAGGHLEFLDGPEARLRVSPQAGRLVAFTSSLENLHRVRRLDTGHRFVFALWFTCEPALAFVDSEYREPHLHDYYYDDAVGEYHHSPGKEGHPPPHDADL